MESVKSTTSNSVTVTVLVSDKERSIAYRKAFDATGKPSYRDGACVY